MKKSIFLAALSLLTGVVLTGCNANTDPRLEPAKGEFKLYVPAENNYTYDLTNKDNSITLTTSGQPDYGVATPTSYQVQISLDDTWKEGVMGDDGEYTVWPTYYSLKTVNTQSVISASALEINQGITYLQGIHEEDQLDLYNPDPCSLYVRIRAYVASSSYEEGYVPYTVVYSNVVKINTVQPSLEPSLPIPAILWVIGQYQGWNENGNEQTAFVDETEYGAGSDIYTGYVNMSAADAAGGFRFFTQLGSWDKEYNIGAAEPDMSTESVTMTDGVYNGPLVKGGQSNWGITNYPGGWMKLIVDLNTNKVSFQYDPDYSE